MRRISLAFILLLLAISCIYADGLPAEEAERQAKKHQLDQLAERFRSETGFRGDINYDTNRMCLGFYEGKFADIQITADADTSAFRAVFEQILNKVLPYTYAEREHLSKSRITNNLGIIQTDYYQQINGYRVEGAGRLAINYEIGRNGFTIGNGTVEVPKDFSINISLDQAIEIAKEVYNPDYKTDKSIKFSDPRTELLYTKNPENQTDVIYRLNYKISFWGLAIYINPSDGSLSYTRSFLIKDFSAHADGYQTAPAQGEKIHRLDKLAEKFKARFGFRGEISYDTTRVCLGFYSGKFAEIQITAEADTATFRSEFEQILNKVLPYTSAKRELLTRSKITKNTGQVRAVYFQQVGGYRVEGAGKISIVYEIGRNGFYIGNGTVELPENVQINISLEQAIRIAQDNELIGDNEKPHKPRIAYVRGDDKNGNAYYLCYILVFKDYVVNIDVSNSVIRNIRKQRTSNSY